ncbi:hypothetical protein C0V72_10130 [Porphyrobacter sp. TH134]|uniref:hypothetical protein n=1 Tax=Porphyrobacter sp. TH134 TaxID=2067450 RepID=UPI000C79CF1B|nr:hypothetical protein [Porphyrobacter sp. TH134]PLK23313.1 hypothetical protein C0V72_10130 [Porphyrobacter sp. TH134]
MRRPRPTSAILAWPLAIFTAGLAGLTIALTGDGWRDAAAWTVLAAPLATVIWAMARRRT